MRRLVTAGLALALVGALATPSLADHPGVSGTIRTSAVRNETHCSAASSGRWGLNEVCFQIPAGVNRATITFPGAPSGLGKGCMIHGSWLMVFITQSTSGTSTLQRVLNQISTTVVDQPVDVTWTDGTGAVTCGLG